MDQIITVGRRKTSTARVFLQKGSGEITVNKKKLEVYFGREVAQMVVKQPLVSTELTQGVDIKATVSGGGSFGQAGAIRLGIARALIEYDETLKPILKKEGFVEVIDDLSMTYKVLNSFSYLEELILSIDIEEATTNEN